MGAFQNIGLQDYFKRYGIRYGLLRGIFMVNPIHAVKDYENKKILYYRKMSGKLSRWMRFSEENPKGLEYGKDGVGECIWIYWRQGFDQAPAIVKRCAESVQRHCNIPVILLSEENVQDYVRMPQYIKEKLEKGTISAAVYSDLLRMSLLEHYGGTWIDATVFLTGPLPDYITQSRLFAYQDSFGLIENPARYANWLLHAQKGNRLIRRTRNILFAYWGKKDHAPEYLFSYLVFTALAREDEEEDAYIPYASSEYTGLLLKELDRTYREEIYRHIISLSTVHKLTYKLKKHVEGGKDTLYERIIRERL